MRERLYTNPVYGGSFPDPFILRYLGEYWAYATDVWSDDRVFGVLRSRDLVEWTPVGGAMDPLPDSPPCYWAPEVTYDNGRFLLYYSAGDEEHMHIRLAVADRPEGPFVDSGHRLTSEQFAIDAHVFVDDDGSRYMFYATDFLEHDRIGTGTVVDRMVDAFTLEGRPRPVTRARYDWQVYDPRRLNKGGVKWHTVEGPFVLKRKNRYYQMFSGGNWQNPSYGVSFATAPAVLVDGEWEQTSDGEIILPILRTLPDQAVGPGHNSVVVGPDGRQLYCAYHRWTDAGRALCVDRQDWAGDRIVVFGPSTGPVPAPVTASLSGFEIDWRSGGGVWALGRAVATQTSTTDVARAHLDAGVTAFGCEVSVRCHRPSPAQGSVGVALATESGTVVSATLRLVGGDCAIGWLSGGEWRERSFALAPDVDLGAYHTFRLDADGRFARVALDDGTIAWSGPVDAAASNVLLVAESVPCDFAGFSLSRGWKNDFARTGGTPEDHGWTVRDGAWRVEALELRAESGLATKPAPARDYELVVTARVVDGGGSWTVAPAMTEEGVGPVVAVSRRGGQCSLEVDGGLGLLCPLDPAFDASHHVLLRFRKVGEEVSIDVGETHAGVVATPAGARLVGLGAKDATVAFDHVRVSELTPPDASR
jgi:GH43 family beta-xylosidase